MSEYGVVSAVGIGETKYRHHLSVTTTCEVKVIPIHVETPGTLSTLLADEQKFKLTNIAISGSLNEFDFLTIIEMSSLKILDISRIDNKTIPKRTFEENRVIEEVILPNGLVEIPDYLFYRSNISKCTIPSKVERIGIESFSRSRLTSVTIPPSVKVIIKAFTFAS